MKNIVLALAVSMVAGSAFAASVSNKDAETVILVVTEDGQRTEIPVASGETVQMCASGCFLTLPNGDRAALSGGETVDIVGGSAVIN